MNTWFLSLVALAVVVLAAVIIYVMLDLRKLIISVRRFLEAEEISLPATIKELNLTLKSLRDATDEATGIMNDIREMSGAVREVGDNVRCVTANVKHLSNDLSNITCAASGRISGIRAGVAVALSVLRKGLWK
jgi:uncharacterized protein YoxC